MKLPQAHELIHGLNSSQKFIFLTSNLKQLPHPFEKTNKQLLTFLC